MQIKLTWNVKPYFLVRKKEHVKIEIHIYPKYSDTLHILKFERPFYYL